MAEIERPDPRISLNKLGEYLVSPAGRRRAIVREQKRPSAFQVAYYPLAERAIRDCICNGDPAVLTRAARDLENMEPNSEWDEQRLNSCYEAVIAFGDLYPDLDLDALQLTAGHGDPPKLVASGVSISVRPEVHVTSGEGDNLRRGLLKLYFGKNDPLTEESGQYISAVLQHYAQTVIVDDSGVDRRLCRVIDVFSGRVFEAPRAFTRRLRDIETACEEIALRWPTA